jgi:hypothetical protein
MLILDATVLSCFHMCYVQCCAKRSEPVAPIKFLLNLLDGYFANGEHTVLLARSAAEGSQAPATPFAPNRCYSCFPLLLPTCLPHT